MRRLRELPLPAETDHMTRFVHQCGAVAQFVVWAGLWLLVVAAVFG